LSVVAGLDLLELIGREDCGELLASLLMNCFHLLFHDEGGDCFVISQGGNLAVSVGQDGFNLSGLIGRKIELFAELRGLALRVVGVVVLRRRGGGGVLLLC
jgi:hypothetical protein